MRYCDAARGHRVHGHCQDHGEDASATTDAARSSGAPEPAERGGGAGAAATAGHGREIAGNAGSGRPLHAVWTAVLTVLWAGPLLGFAIVHAKQPPPGAVAIAVAGLALAGLLARRRLPRAYCASARWELRGEMYRRLGVRTFGDVVPHGRWLNRLARRHASPGTQRAGGRVATAAARGRLAAETGDSERTHVWWLLTSLAFILWAAAIGRSGIAAALLLLNVPLNVYPILLQRDTRARLRRIADRSPTRMAPPGGAPSRREARPA